MSIETTLEIINSLKQEADQWLSQNRVQKAINCYKQALTHLENIQDPIPFKEKDTLYTLLGKLWRQQGKHRTTLSYYQKALENLQTQHGQTPHTDTAIAHFRIGSLYDHLCKYKNAATHYKHALDLSEKTLGPQHDNTLYVQNAYEKAKSKIVTPAHV